MHSVRPLLILLALLASNCPVRAAEAPVDSLRELFHDAWQFRLRENPLFATYYGDHRFNDRLPKVAPADQVRRLEARREFLARLEAIDRNALPLEERTNYDIFRRLLTDEIAEDEFRSYLMPITNRSGFHINFPELPRRVPLASVDDYENYVARLRAFARYTDEHIELMRLGIEQGLVLPAVVLKDFETPIQAHLVDDPRDSLLYAPFDTMPDSFTVADRTRLEEAGRAAIADFVVPAYRRFLNFMRDEYVPAAPTLVGASALPSGRAFYRHRVRRYTTLDLTPQEVHDLGLREVERIGDEMRKVIDGTGFEGTFEEFVTFLREDSRFYAETPEQLLKEVSLVLKRMDGLLPSLFKTLPRMPYGVRQVPPYIAEASPTAYYTGPSGDGTRAGFYYVNTSNLRSRPLFEVEALSLHEAVPGHHLQIALQQELEGLPPFRRFAGFTAFVEGWGLYAERLGLEVGFYEDPYSDFGRLSYEMWRACRLVVDTGMHYLGWTRQEAIDFMQRHTALSTHNITTEVDRYISWPGQALAYKIGELKIRDLRARAEEVLGPAFDIREFHDVVLGAGGVPLDVLEANVERYIEEAQAAE